jgi:O-methyltransferase
MLNRIKSRIFLSLQKSQVTSPSQPTEPDMNFLRRVAVKEAIFNVSTAVRFESDSIPISESLKGDYMEFGVYQGSMFEFVLREASEKMPWMRFFACDSFQGLPKPRGVDVDSEFVEGQFSCSEEQFIGRIEKVPIEQHRVVVVPGWFDQSLSEDNASHLNIRIISIAYVDCDLYESCIPVLNFLSQRVRQGTVLMFDDWFCFKANPKRGIPLAVSEWLARNPRIELIPWRPFSSHGQSFFVNLL